MKDETMDNQQGNVLERIGYSVGLILGDGCLYSDPLNGDYRVTITLQDKECLERVVRELGEASRPIKRHWKAAAWELTYYSKVMCQGWRELTDNKTVVPYYYALEEASKEARLDVIAGLLDSDGSIKQRFVKENWNYELAFYNGEFKIVDAFTGLLKLCGIRVTRVRQYTTQSGRPGYDVGIVLKDFVEGGGYFHCQRKQERLENYKQRITGRWSAEHRRPSETKPVEPREGCDIVHT